MLRDLLLPVLAAFVALGCGDHRITPILRADEVAAAMAPDSGANPETTPIDPPEKPVADDGGTAPRGCAADLAAQIVVAPVTPLSWARPGAVFSQPPPSTYVPRMIEVSFRTTAGVPVVGCEVRWTPAPGSGWVFPVSPVTDSNGRAQAWWTAGPDRAETLEAALVLEGALVKVTVNGTVEPGRALTDWIEVIHDVTELDGLSLELTPLAAPGATRFGVQFANCFAALDDVSAEGSSQPQRFVSFSCWDVNNVRIEVVDSGASGCLRDGSWTRCSRALAWSEGNTYTWEVATEFNVPGRTDFTMYLTGTSAVRTKLATLRRDQEVRPTYCLTYLQNLGVPHSSCLDSPPRSALIGNIQQRNAGTWRPIKTGKFGRAYEPNLDEICANYQYGTLERSFLLSLGGDTVGPPLVPGMPKPQIELP